MRRPTREQARYEQLARELVRAVRGERSQPAMSRRLGFASNAQYGWESGRRFPLASTFFRMVELRRPAVSADLNALLSLPAERGAPALSSTEGVAHLLRALCEGRSTSELARSFAVDRATVTRWLRARSEPKLPELLRVLDGTTVRLLDLVALFADPARIPSLAQPYRNLQAQRRLAYALPLSHAVARALELRPRGRRKPEPAFLAERIGVEPAEVEAMLRTLIDAGQVVRRDGRYELAAVLTVDTAQDPEADLQLKQFWAELGLARLRRTKARGEGYFSYNLFAISERNFARARQLHAEYYGKLRELVAEDRDPQRVVLSNLQLIPLDE